MLCTNKNIEEQSRDVLYCIENYSATSKLLCSHTYDVTLEEDDDDTRLILLRTLLLKCTAHSKVYTWTLVLVNTIQVGNSNIKTLGCRRFVAAAAYHNHTIGSAYCKDSRETTTVPV